MKFSLYIAFRYFFSKKSLNLVNIISGVSVMGVTISTFAFIVVLSVFNGLETTLTSLFNTFDPDFKITITEGKTFKPDTTVLQNIQQLDGVARYSKVVEENVLIKYNDLQVAGTIKGVDTVFREMTEIDKMMVNGNFQLYGRGNPFAVVGLTIAANLSLGLRITKPIHLYAPRRDAKINVTNPQAAFRSELIYPVGIFSVQQEYDSKYVVTPISFAQKLFGYLPNEITALEVQMSKDANIDEVQKNLQNTIGEGYTIKNRFQQHDLFWKTLKSEKFVSFVILLFILIISSFNIVGTMSILIIGKERDIVTLNNLGATKLQIKNIFIAEGCLISVLGLTLGTLLGLTVCWLQNTFGLIAIKGAGAFVIDYLPVEVRFSDLMLVLVTVLAIGVGASIYSSGSVFKYIRNKDSG